MKNRELFRAEALPILQNRVYASRDEALASPVGDVVLVQDAESGLVANAAFDPDRIVYDEGYQNEQAHSPAFQRHLDEVLGLIKSRMGEGRILEIGCGKGYFLERMRAAGIAATGVDPAYEGRSPHVVKARFEPGLGLSGDGIVLRHVLEHIPDPAGFLAAIGRANGGRGTIYIEVPCLDWVCNNRAWFDVFYEHVNYFRLRDLRRLFSRVVDSGRLFGGQYIYIVADLSSLRVPKADAADGFHFPPDFLAGVEQCARRAESHRGSRAVWGGSSKGVIFCTYLARRGVRIDSVIDINHAKQGRYVPVTGLPVIAPDAAVFSLEKRSLVFVMNPNYYDEIVEQSGSRFDYCKV